MTGHMLRGEINFLALSDKLKSMASFQDRHMGKMESGRESAKGIDRINDI